MKKVAIFGLPRTGTSWLGQLFNSSPNTLYKYQPLFSYEFKNYLNEYSSKIEINNFHNNLAKKESEFLNTKYNFNKTNITHLIWKEVRYHNITKNLLKESDLKIVFIKRDIVDMINSWYLAPKEFNKEWSIEEEWERAEKKNKGRSEEFNGVQRALEAIDIHQQNKLNYPERVKIIDYEKLVSNTTKILGEVYDFCELELTEQTLNFINKSTTTHEEDSYSVFKSKKTKNILPEKVVNDINDLINQNKR